LAFNLKNVVYTSKTSCKKIEDYLYEKKLHLPLLGKKPDKMEDAEWALLDR
jgi:hypothetical protein